MNLSAYYESAFKEQESIFRDVEDVLRSGHTLIVNSNLTGTFMNEETLHTSVSWSGGCCFQEVISGALDKYNKQKGRGEKEKIKSALLHARREVEFLEKELSKMEETK